MLGATPALVQRDLAIAAIAAADGMTAAEMISATTVAEGSAS
jgi:hypothetical protein